MNFAKPLVTALAAVGLIISGLLFVAGAASAQTCDGEEDSSTIGYGCGDDGDDGDDGAAGGDTDGSSTPSEPPCDLSKDPYTEFCEGDVACWGNNPAAMDKDSAGAIEKAGEKPGDDYQLAYKSCADGSSEWYWTKDKEGPSLPELAEQAFGALRFPAYTLKFNPQNRTFVNLPTWWWADGATTDRLIGTSAGTVRAIATPREMQVDPGDGSGVKSCRFVVTKSDECSHVYVRASVRGTAVGSDGSRAYAARARLVYDVVMENNGTPIEVPGIPDVFTSPWQESPVPVREVQTVVRPKS